MTSQSGPDSDDLLDQLAEAEHRAWEMERELRETRASTSFRLGRSIVSATKRPSKLLRLPAEIWRLYRGRQQPTNAADQIRTGPERLLTFYRSLGERRGGPQIALVGSRRTVQALGGSFDVVPLWPHDAKQIASAVTPDLALVESGASMPGEAWSALGTAAEAGLGEHLAEVIRGFQGRSVPVVFWWTTPVDVTGDLNALVQRCDWVVADTSVPGVPDAAPLSLGVDLREVEPMRLGETNDADRPLLHLGGYEPDPTTSPANWLVKAAIEAGAQVLREPSYLHPGDGVLRRNDKRLRYRRATWTTPTAADPSHRCLAMLASGVPLLVEESHGEFDRVVERVQRSTDIPEVVGASRQRIGAPEGMAEILRTIHRYGTSRQRFHVVLEHFGIRLERSAEDGIGVSVEAESNASSVVAAIAGQSIRPVEVLVSNQDARRRLSLELQNWEVPVRLVADAEAARHAVWSGKGWRQTYLHDLLVASQVLGTDSLLDEKGVAMTGTMGEGKALPWWISEADVA